MARNNVHVTYKNNTWNVKSEKTSRASYLYGTKEEALARGKEIAMNKGVELIIHGKDGRIQDADSYGNDPIPPRDRVM